MPSSPTLQAWAKMVGPSPSICSLKRRPRPALARKALGVDLPAIVLVRADEVIDEARAFISLFGGLAAAWSLTAHAHAQESATMRATEATIATLPQIEVVRVRPVDRMPPSLRLSESLIDLMKDFSISSAEGIGGAWGVPPRPSTPFDERYGQW